MVDESMLEGWESVPVRMTYVLCDPGSQTVVDHAFALCRRPRKSFRVLGERLFADILRDLPKRPGGQLNEGTTFKEGHGY